MGAGWVAGSVRARLLARHRLGTDGAREVAMAGSIDAARVRLEASTYSRAIAVTDSVASAQHAIWATVVWDLRVLAGWLPGAGVAMLRAFAGFFEIENIAGQIAALASGEPTQSFELGSLGTVSTRVGQTVSVRELRALLQMSPWRDPGADAPARILTSVRCEWARRLAEINIEGVSALGSAAAALVIARSLAEHDEPAVDDIRRRVGMLGRRALDATTLASFVAALPDSARWVFDGGDTADDLWRAEVAWWRRLDHDGERSLRAARPGSDVVAGAAAVRMADAWRTCAAFDIASRGASAEELVDVVA